MKLKDVYVFRVPEGREIMSYLRDFAEKNEIKCGSIRAIGALKNAEIGYFSTEKGEYLRKRIDEQCELLSLAGNVSQKADSPFLHIHVVLGTPEFEAIGGHLISGEVFVAEVIIEEYYGRCPRVKSGNLYLWEAKE